MIIWLIGISGAGKTTLGNKIHKYFIEKKLYPNVDFYSGIILRAIGFPP